MPCARSAPRSPWRVASPPPSVTASSAWPARSGRRDAVHDGARSPRACAPSGTPCSMVQATSVLSLEHRAEVDRRVGPLLGRLGVRGAERAARRVAQELDVASVRAADGGCREVPSRHGAPGADGMAYLTVLGPLRRGRRCLGGACERARAGGRVRSVPRRGPGGSRRSVRSPPTPRFACCPAAARRPAPAGRGAPRHDRPVAARHRRPDPVGDGAGAHPRPRLAPGAGRARLAAGRPTRLASSSRWPPASRQQVGSGNDAPEPAARLTVRAPGSMPIQADGCRSTRCRRRCGCDGCTRAPTAATWSPWTRAAACFTGLLRRMLVLRDDVCTHAVVRGTDRARRPHHAGSRRRRHELPQGTGQVRPVQLRQGGSRLGHRPSRGRGHARAASRGTGSPSRRRWVARTPPSRRRCWAGARPCAGRTVGSPQQSGRAPRARSRSPASSPRRRRRRSRRRRRRRRRRSRPAAPDACTRTGHDLGRPVVAATATDRSRARHRGVGRPRAFGHLSPRTRALPVPHLQAVPADISAMRPRASAAS